MKDKIEITQADLLDLMVEKIKFLTSEYKNLHDSFEYKGRGRVKTDALKLTSSHQSFLSEEGDIRRLLKLYEQMLDNDNKKTIASK